MSYNNNTPIVEHIITTYKLICICMFFSLFVTRDEITIRRCFILMPYVLVKTNFSLKFGYMICLRLKYRATEKFCEIKALESYKLL